MEKNCFQRTVQHDFKIERLHDVGDGENYYGGILLTLAGVRSDSLRSDDLRSAYS